MFTSKRAHVAQILMQALCLALVAALTGIAMFPAETQDMKKKVLDETTVLTIDNITYVMNQNSDPSAVLVRCLDEEDNIVLVKFEETAEVQAMLAPGYKLVVKTKLLETPASQKLELKDIAAVLRPDEHRKLPNVDKTISSTTPEDQKPGPHEQPESSDNGGAALPGETPTEKPTPDKG